MFAWALLCYAAALAGYALFKLVRLREALWTESDRVKTLADA